MLTISHHIIWFFLSRYTYLLLSTNFETAASTASVPSIRRELSIGYSRRILTLFSSQILEKSYQQHIISVSFNEKKNVVFTPKTAQNQICNLMILWIAHLWAKTNKLCCLVLFKFPLVYSLQINNVYNKKKRCDCSLKNSAVFPKALTLCSHCGNKIITRV